jgi:hypothetical protein
MQVATAELPERRLRRGASKPARAQASEKTKATFYLTSDAVRRLGIASVMEDTTASALVERMIQDTMRRYVVLTRGGDRSQPAGEPLTLSEDRQVAGDV